MGSAWVEGGGGAGHRRSRPLLSCLQQAGVLRGGERGEIRSCTRCSLLTFSLTLCPSLSPFCCWGLLRYKKGLWEAVQISSFKVLYVLFWRLKASPVALTSFMDVYTLQISKLQFFIKKYLIFFSCKFFLNLVVVNPDPNPSLLDESV